MYFKYSNFTAKDSKKYFKSLKGREKLINARNIVDICINTNAYTQEVTLNIPHLIQSAEYILDRESKRKISKTELAKTFNNVLTKINNNAGDLNKISKLWKHLIHDEDGIIKIGDFYIKSIKSDQLFSNNPQDFFWLYENNQIYLVLPMDETADNDLSVVISDNLYGNQSVKVPLIFKDDINTAVLNGKDWVKSYILSEDIGYIYFIKAKIKEQIFYKVGISKNKDRFKYKNVEILDSNFIEMKMLKAALIEQYIHIINTDRRLFLSNIDNTFEGKNECYHVDLMDFYKRIDIEECVKVVCAYKNYNINTLRYAIN